MREARQPDARDGRPSGPVASDRYCRVCNSVWPFDYLPERNNWLASLVGRGDLVSVLMDRLCGHACSR